MGNRLIIIGAGGFSKEVVELAELNRFSIIGHVSSFDVENKNSFLGNLTWIQNNSDKFDSLFIGFGAVSRRSLKNRKNIREFLDQYPHCKTSLISPTAIISSKTNLGARNFIAHGVIINTDSILGDDIIINTSAVIGHDVNIGNGSIIGPMSLVTGGVTIGEDTLIGAGVTVTQNISIGNNVTISAGAVITSDIPDGATVILDSKIITTIC